MATNMGSKKKRIIDDATVITSSLIQPVFGGDSTAPQTSPNFAGHFHDLPPGVMGDTWGHAPQIDLSSDTTNRLVLKDAYAVLKSVGLPSSAASTLGNSIVWYFTLPTDIDITKSAYFNFAWMGDSTDGYDNITSTIAQTSTFKITWQWYIPGYAILAPAVIYDAQPPANQPGSNINANTLSRGRLPNFTVNTAPFQLLINDSATGNANQVQLTGLNQAQSSVMVGVQVEVLSTGFSNGVIFFNGNLVYLSKTMGSPAISVNVLNG